MTAAACAGPVTARGAVARLRQARDRLAALGARPYVAGCERELQACGAEITPESGPAPVEPDGIGDGRGTPGLHRAF
jgi:hypothetical protein